MTKKSERMSELARELALARWSRIPKSERAQYMPTGGGARRKYPKCPRYRSHMFSKTTHRCPCGYVQPEKHRQ
jgi:hypothetical protein